MSASDVSSGVTLSSFSSLPWQHSLWQHFTAVHDNGRLPHAVMLSGPSGLGKHELADAMIARVLCRTAQGKPGAAACGECHGCHMLAAGHHPDLMAVAPQDVGKMIRIDPIREVNRFVSQTAQQGGYRVIRLQPAESMNIASANALLKSLEEPGANTLFILLSDMPSRVLPTIRSRCQQWPLVIPPAEESLPWLTQQLGEDAQALLRMAGGLPQLAVRLGEAEQRQLRQALRELFDALVRGGEPVAEAWRLERQPLAQVLWYGIAWLEDLIRMGLSGNASDLRDPSLEPLLRQAVKNGRTQDWFKLLDFAREQRRLLAAGGNPNPQLVLEAWLVRWAALLRS
ncbi:DNA polymerase III subunit delta' [uncultured Cobetia sp.]|jgi:DNA polymerase-3 subunit delta'|uniref:DNA polymerase III subunit delta' n=1 Tax=uncultured Cobetia sp. TaxID=410706 RepID=UPI0030ED1D22|tara:strand:- start:276 stop:1301 length:1026 start_codon:yes stop_codon:yes gene_type:complete